ncbi:MAG: hypothetical protein AAGA15_07735 [Pseudomonadota bacterium]
MASFVQDFQIIRQSPLLIGDGAPRGDQEEREVSFRMHDIQTNQPCILHFEVSGLTIATENPAVEINNRKVGEIQRFHLNDKGANGENRFWMHQSLIVPANRVVNGNNTLEITAPGWKHSNTNDRYDDFQIRNIVIFYRTHIAAQTISA